MCVKLKTGKQEIGREESSFASWKIERRCSGLLQGAEYEHDDRQGRRVSRYIFRAKAACCVSHFGFVLLNLIVQVSPHIIFRGRISG